MVPKKHGVSVQKTGKITGLRTGIESPVPPHQAIEFAQDSGTRKFFNFGRQQ
jgi:hypothetical protein